MRANQELEDLRGKSPEVSNNVYRHVYRNQKGETRSGMKAIESIETNSNKEPDENLLAILSGYV